MTLPQQLLDADDGRVVVPRLMIARLGGVAAVRGLLGRDGLPDDAGLLLRDPLGCIHTIGMRFAIDIVFLSRALEVRTIAEDVPPGRIAWRPGSLAQVELAAGRAAALGLARGRRLAVGASAGGSIEGGSPHAVAASGGPGHEAAERPCAVTRGVPSVRASERRRGAPHHPTPTREGRPCPQPCW
jgi:uncharacterized membrane protein (UPF0127 family)